MDTDLGPQIDEMLRAFGYAPLEYKGWRMLDDGLPGVRGVLRPALADHPTVAQADFEIMAPGGETIVESFGVLGDDDAARARAAIDKLAQGTLPAVLAGLRGDARAEEAVQRLAWTAPDGRRWDVWAAQWLLVAFDDQVEAPAGTILEALEPRIVTRLGDAHPHWFRVVRSQITDAPSTEVMWDNQRWPEAEDAIDAHGWPNRRQTARRFVLLTPAAED